MGGLIGSLRGAVGMTGSAPGAIQDTHDTPDSVSGFGDCEVCGARRWLLRHGGPVRTGAFGAAAAGRVAECGGCGVARLEEASCLGEVSYEAADYREAVGDGAAVAGYFEGHDRLQVRELQLLSSRRIRGNLVADIGCGGGSFLDYVHTLAAQTVAVEPFAGYHESLRERGHRVFAYAEQAAAAFAGLVDLATAFAVIEHVADPVAFLRDIRKQMKPDGCLVVSTPNRLDLLMELLPEDYPAFFYRTAHRWYFDAGSLGKCAERAGFAVERTVHYQRYGPSNAFAWLRDRRPTGDASLPGLESTVLDSVWRRTLEERGVADYLYMFLRPVAAAQSVTVGEAA